VEKREEERRKYERFDTDVKIYYEVEYDLETKVEYELVDDHGNGSGKYKHEAVSKNVSVEGLAFLGPEQLEKGNKLMIEVYLPGDNEPVFMRGEVRWSKLSLEKSGSNKLYDTGVLVSTIGENSVRNSIYFDEENKLYWSSVLESILGKFRIIGQKRQKEKNNET